MKKLSTEGSIVRSYTAGELPAGSYRAFFKGDFNAINSSNSNGFTTLPATYQIGSTDTKKEIKKEQLDTSRDGWNYAVDEDRKFWKDDFSSNTSANYTGSANYVWTNGRLEYNNAQNSSITTTNPIGTSKGIYNVTGMFRGTYTTGLLWMKLNIEKIGATITTSYSLFIIRQANGSSTIGLYDYSNTRYIINGSNIGTISLETLFNMSVRVNGNEWEIYYNDVSRGTATYEGTSIDGKVGIQVYADNGYDGATRSEAFTSFSFTPLTSYSDPCSGDTTARYQAISGTNAFSTDKINLTATAGNWNKTRLKSYKFESGRVKEKLILPATGYEGDIVCAYISGSADMATNYGVGVKRLSSNLWLPVEIKDNVVITTGISPVAPIQDGNTVVLEVETDTAKGVAWLNVWNETTKNVMVFDANDDKVTLNSNTNLTGLTAKSVFIWCKVPAYTGTARVIYDGGYWTSTYGDLLTTNALANGIGIYQKNTAGTAVNKQILFIPDTWVCIGYTWDGSKVTYYLNGLQYGTQNDLTGTLGCSSYAITFGMNTSNTQQFNGVIGSVRIYNTALSASDVLALYNGKHISTGLVGWWVNTGNTDADWVDRIGSNNGIVSGTPTTVAVTGTKVQGTTLKQFAPYQMGYTGVGLKNSRVVNDISTSDVVSNDHSITEALLDISPYAVPAGSVLYDGNNAILTKAETVTTQIGDVDIYDVKNVATLKTRVWDNTNGDCKVWDTAGQVSEANWIRVYSTAWTFTGDIVVDNGLIRFRSLSGYFVAQYYNGSAWVSIVGNRIYPFIYGAGSTVTINSLSTDKVVIRAAGTGIDSKVYDATFEIKRGGNAIKLYDSNQAVLTHIYSTYRFFYSTNGTLYDAVINGTVTPTPISYGYGFIDPVNPYIGINSKCDSLNLSVGVSGNKYSSIPIAKNKSSCIGAVPFDCSKLYYEAEAMSSYGAGVINYVGVDAYPFTGTTGKTINQKDSYVLKQLVVGTDIPVGSYKVYIRTKENGGAVSGNYGLYIRNATTSQFIIENQSYNPSDTFSLKSFNFVISSNNIGNSINFYLYQNANTGTISCDFDYMLIVPTGLIEKHAKRSLFNLVETPVASDKLISLKLLESRARSLIGYTNVPATETVVFNDDFSVDSRNSYVNPTAWDYTVGSGLQNIGFTTIYTKGIYGKQVTEVYFTPTAVDSIGICRTAITFASQDTVTGDPFSQGNKYMAYCRFDTAAKSIRLVKISNGTLSDLVTLVTFTMSYGTQYKMKVDFDPSRSTDKIKVYVVAAADVYPSTPTLVSNDTTFCSGYSGVGYNCTYSTGGRLTVQKFSLNGTRLTYKPMLRGAGVGSFHDGTNEVQAARFTDDFEYGSTDNALTYHNSFWEIVDNKIHKKKDTNYSLLTISSCKFANGSYKFTWNPISNITSQGFTSINPVFCCDTTGFIDPAGAGTTNKLYYVTIRTGNTDIYLRKRDGTSTPIALGTLTSPITMSNGNEYNFEITLNNGVINIYINNLYVGSVTDSTPLSAGYFGFFNVWAADPTGHEYYLKNISINAVPDVSTTRLLGGSQYGGFFLNDGNPVNTGNWAGFKFKNHDRDTTYTSTLNRGAIGVASDATSYKIIRTNVTDTRVISPTKEIEENITVTNSAATITTNDITLDADDANDNIVIYTATRTDTAPVLPLVSQSLARNSGTDTSSNGYYYVDFDVGDDALDVGIWETDVGENYWKMDYMLVVPKGLIEREAKRSLVNLGESTSYITE